MALKASGNPLPHSTVPGGQRPLVWSLLCTLQVIRLLDMDCGV